MSAIDHKAEVQAHYEEAVEANQNGKWETARFEMQLAKFHTEMFAAEQTAELVKQQKLANLIAFMDIESGPFKDINNIKGAHAIVLGQISEGLGLA